jgi:acetyl/propionyl-CoA carboxylase alpha subunit
MSEIKGKVGPWELTFKSIPRGPTGVAQVEVKGAILDVRWRRDRDGIWLELPWGTFGFDFRGTVGDDGLIHYDVSQRESHLAWSELGWTRAGEESAAAAAGAAKKGVRIRAQMPGKITRVLVAAGAEVQKDQALFVMEAMKMENEIRAPQAGKVDQLKVVEGQAVETGADLCILGL